MMRSLSLFACLFALVVSLPQIYGWATYPTVHVGHLPAFVQLQFVEISKIDGVEQAFAAVRRAKRNEWNEHMS